MDSHADNRDYGENLIDVYDLMYYGRTDVDLLPKFCRVTHPAASTVLEFGIGTGRLAIPLASAGFHVSGIEASKSMISVLRDRAQGLDIYPVLGDFREQQISQRFDLVLILTNTLFMSDSVDDQRRTLTQARDRLAPGGRLVVETYDPYFYLERPTPFSVTLPLAPTVLLTDTVIVDRLAQRVTQIHSFTRPTRIDTITEYSNWLTARELDLVAESVGLERVTRFSDFEQNAISNESRNIVTTYAVKAS